jgi:hypothetical protein
MDAITTEWCKIYVQSAGCKLPGIEKVGSGSHNSHLYLESARFKSRSGYRPSCPTVFIVFLSTCKQVPESCLKLVTIAFFHTLSHSPFTTTESFDATPAVTDSLVKYYKYNTFQNNYIIRYEPNYDYKTIYAKVLCRSWWYVCWMSCYFCYEHCITPWRRADHSGRAV